MKPMHIMIREYREDHGITQTYIAKRIGTHPKRLSALEAGTIRLTADEFLRICIDGFGITPQNFFDYQFPETEN